MPIRHAARALLRSPGFTLLATLSLALGIGASTTAYSLLDAWLLQPLRFPHADRLTIGLKAERSHPDAPAIFAGYRDYLAWKAGARSFDAVSAVFWRTFTLTGGAEPDQVNGMMVTADIFDTLGLQAGLGRTFQPADVTGPPLVVLHDNYWQRRLAGRRDVIGLPLRLNGRVYQVAGVLRQGEGLRIIDQWADSSIYAVLQQDEPGYAPDQAGPVAVIARLAPGVAIDTARTELTVLQRAADARHPENPKDYVPHLASLQADNTRTVRSSLLTLGASAIVVLLIVCANVASLLLGRAIRARRELAIRLALGSSRARLAREVLLEHGLLGLIGGAAGVALAQAAVRAFVAFKPLGPLLPPRAIAVDERALAFALAITIAAVLLFGSAPLLELWRLDLQPLLTDGGSRGASAGSRAHRLRNAIVVLEVAACVILLVSALLLVRTMVRVRAEPMGFEPRDVTAIEVVLPAEIYDDVPRRDGLVARLRDRLLAAPGVEAVGATTSDAVQSGPTDDLEVEGRPKPPSQGTTLTIDRQLVTPGYFDAIRVPLIAGRGITADDRARTEPVVWLNQSAARYWFPAEDPVGQRVRLSGDPTWRRIAGIVGDTRSTFYDTLGWRTERRVYLPYEQGIVREREPVVAHHLLFYVRGTQAWTDASARAAIWSVERTLPISDLYTLTAHLDDAMRQPRLRSVLLGGFALIALGLAVVGLYGSVAQTVSQRLRELGIRMALGATARDVALLVVRQAGTLTAIGLAVGLAGALAATRLLSALLYGVAPTDPLTYAAVCALLAAATLAGSYAPARRAARVDPASVLRDE